MKQRASSIRNVLQRSLYETKGILLCNSEIKKVEEKVSQLDAKKGQPGVSPKQQEILEGIAKTKAVLEKLLDQREAVHEAHGLLSN